MQRARELHRKALALQRRLRERAEAAIIVDEQGGEAHTGSRNVNRLPSAVRTKSSVPPCASIARFAIDRPRPMPRGLVVTKGRKSVKPSGGPPALSRTSIAT